MRKYFLILFLFAVQLQLSASRVTYTLVALCDNKYQGIAPVPASIGNGDSPSTNLYWGCGYGVYTFFKKNPDWEMIYHQRVDSVILDRCVFYNKKQDVYHVADAYRGREIEQCNIDFFKALAGKLDRVINVNLAVKIDVKDAILVNYVGHDGLMDFIMDEYPIGSSSNQRKATVLACFSKSYYWYGIEKAGAFPYIWTTHLMAPEAYTLLAIIDCWMKNQSGELAREAAAQAYNKYQKCGIKGARNLFSYKK